MTIKIEKRHNSRQFHRVKEKCSAHAQKIQNGVQLPVPSNYESRYSVMNEDFSPSLHILDQSERNCVGRKCICFFYIELAIAWLEKEIKKE